MGEPRPRQTTTLLRRAGTAGLLLLAVGCTTDSSRDGGKRDDPLLGIGARPAYQTPATPTSNPGSVAQGPPPPAYQPQPPLTAAMPTSNAALAGGFQPLRGGNDLRIGAGAPTAPGGPVAQPVAGVQAVPPPGAPASPPAATPIGVPTAAGTLDQAYAAVTARGPLAYQMKFNSQTGEYTFQMKVPSKLNTAAVQSVEASAATPTDAIKRTLEQLAN
jgi:regulator of sigma E protease